MPAANPERVTERENTEDDEPSLLRSPLTARQRSDESIDSSQDAEELDPDSPNETQGRELRHRGRKSGKDAPGNDRGTTIAGEETSSEEVDTNKAPSESYYYDSFDESCPETGLFRREATFLHRLKTRRERKPLKQRVEGLVQELRRRQANFKLRSQSVNQQLRHQLLSQQEQIVKRSRQMTAKLQSGRSRAWRHKWVFALVQLDFLVSAFWLGKRPDTYYLYYTAQMALIIASKILDYRVKAQHYFLLDFCFFANYSVLFWLWFMPSSGMLFNIADGVCGLLAISVVVFRNSCVPHDFVRISNAYVHYPAVVCMLSVKMQCEGDMCLGIERGSEMGWLWRLKDAYIGYLSWAAVYASVIFIFARNRIDRKQRDTLYKYFAVTLGFKEKLPKALRPYSQVVFMAGHQTLFLFGIPWLFFPLALQILITIVAITAFFHNGGRFYVDHFWKAYERNTAQYVDAAYSAMSQAEADNGAPSPDRRDTELPALNGENAQSGEGVSGDAAATGAADD
mmetsp:Transcript_110531/g.276788  ORF Transcript_110531/g.276788 Transcript_110531/m.276788 type:complete len:511 (+) Transcript_110531:81-1613(+)